MQVAERQPGQPAREIEADDATPEEGLEPPEHVVEEKHTDE
jgi:hypothetical protein